MLHSKQGTEIWRKGQIQTQIEAQLPNLSITLVDGNSVSLGLLSQVTHRDRVWFDVTVSGSYLPVSSYPLQWVLEDMKRFSHDTTAAKKFHDWPCVNNLSNLIGVLICTTETLLSRLNPKNRLNYLESCRLLNVTLRENRETKKTRVTSTIMRHR